MDRLDRLLELVDPLVAAVLVLVAVGGFVLMPRRWQLPGSLFLLGLTQTLARLPELPGVVVISLLVIGPCYVAIIAAVLMDPAPRRPLPGWSLAMLAVSALAVGYVTEAQDAPLAVAARLQWLLMALAASLLAASIDSQERLTATLTPLCLGLGLGCGVTLTPFLLDPSRGIAAGYGRYMPFGCNPNQIGSVYAATAILGGHLWLQRKPGAVQVACMLSGALALALLVITVSRLGLLMVALAVLAMVPVLARRPWQCAVLVLVLGFGLFRFLMAADGMSFTRMDAGLDRSHFWMAALGQLEDRPWFGMLGVANLRVFNGDENVHNAYLSFLCLGGLSLGIPLFAWEGRSLLAGGQLLVRQWLSGRDTATVAVLLAYAVGLKASGFANEIVYYPVYTAAFMNVLLSGLFLGAVARRAAGAAARVPTGGGAERPAPVGGGMAVIRRLPVVPAGG